MPRTRESNDDVLSGDNSSISSSDSNYERDINVISTNQASRPRLGLVNNFRDNNESEENLDENEGIQNIFRSWSRRLNERVRAIRNNLVSNNNSTVNTRAPVPEVNETMTTVLSAPSIQPQPIEFELLSGVHVPRMEQMTTSFSESFFLNNVHETRHTASSQTIFQQRDQMMHTFSRQWSLDSENMRLIRRSAQVSSAPLRSGISRVGPHFGWQTARMVLNEGIPSRNSNGNMSHYENEVVCEEDHEDEDENEVEEVDSVEEGEEDINIPIDIRMPSQTQTQSTLLFSSNNPSILRPVDRRQHPLIRPTVLSSHHRIERGMRSSVSGSRAEIMRNGDHTARKGLARLLDDNGDMVGECGLNIDLVMELLCRCKGEGSENVDDSHDGRRKNKRWGVVLCGDKKSKAFSVGR